MQNPRNGPFFSERSMRFARVVAVNIPRGTALYAIVTDTMTGSEFTVPMSAPSRIKPQVGDVWAMDTALGTWNFRSLLTPARELKASNLRSIVQTINDLGLVAYDPNETAGRIEAPHAAYVGEIRMFSGTAVPTGWLVCNFAAYSRARYHLLFGEIGTSHGVGDGSTTFNVPNMAALSVPGSVVYAICAY